MPSSTRSVRGLGARLLLAFFAISVFSALVAGAAIYAFHQVGRSLDLVDRRVDPILAANEVSRSVERIVNSSGNLSSVTTEQARERVFAGLSAKSAKLQSLLTQLRDAGIAEERLAPIEKYAAQLDADLTALDGDVRRRLQLIGLIKDLMRGVFDTNDETQRLLSPTLLVYDSQITRLVGLMDTSAGGTEPTWQTIRPLISGLLAERDAQRVQQQTSNIADGLAQASVSEDTQRLVILAFQLRRKVVDLEKGAQGLDPKLRPLFLAEVDKFKTLVDGSDSIPLLRQRELDIVADANRLIAENSALSDQLTAASEELVQATRREVKAATGSAFEVQRVSTEAITALVVLSLLTSLLIVWRYVGRNIVARLNRLSAAMLVIAGGDHREEVMVSGDDEIAAMGQAVEVFRQNAIERDELLAERAEAAERLEQTVADRTAELTESLEYQTATSDVLKVISRSTFDLQPVLQALVETAARLCETDMAFLLCREKETFRSGAAVGFSDEYKKYLGTHPLPISRGSTTGRVALEKRIIHIPDCAADPEYTHNQSVELAGQRTSLGVPLLREDDVIGAIVLARKRVEPFTERQIELVRTFADQAVIAMENARLITETGEALEQQTATAEVLQVINSSTGDLAPVFATVAESAVMLCGADKAFIFRYDGELLLAEATFNASEELKEFVAQNPIRPGRHSGAARCALERRTVHIPDVIADPEYGYGAKAVDPIRTVLAVPMLKGDELLGVILVYHFEVRPFSDKQIALIETFADQAAIAIENTRLITETREALQQQTATAEVLGVINASPGQVAPVFDTMLDKAMRLCEAAFGALFLFEDDRFTPAASHSVPGAYAAFLAANTMLPGPGTAPYRFLRGGERAVIQEEDLADSGPYRAGDPQRRALVDLGGARSTIQVPLRKDAAVLGVITLYRQEVRPFSEKQTALLQNFAAQAVIAMENARLITETRERTAELQESLEYQTATSDVLRSSANRMLI